MTLYISATTNCPDLMIDYIEVKLRSGEEISLSWDESDIDRIDEDFSSRHKGVYFDEEYANGRLRDLDGMEVIGIQLYSDVMDHVSLVIHEMEFEDGDDRMIFREPYSVFGDDANG